MRFHERMHTHIHESTISTRIRAHRHTHLQSLHRHRSIKVAFSLAHVHALHLRSSRARAHAGRYTSDWRYVLQGASAACGSSIHKLATDRATNYSDRTCFKSWTVTTDLPPEAERKPGFADVRSPLAIQHGSPPNGPFV